tara:strand:- start:1286 stop:2245 length:960 start_codon:yes stop_codon:yes gene_type:complete
MQHKNTHTSSLLAIKKYVKSLPKCLAQRSDLELVDVINAQNQQSEPAKTIIIYRYLPKVLKESKKIFNGQTRDYWHQDEIVQTGVKAILYAIRDFNNQEEKDKKTSAFFTYLTTVYISNYLNKKKINYDPLIQFNKGPEFKKVFYNYFKVLKIQIAKKNGEYNKITDKELLEQFNTNIDTLREVQYAHQQISVIKRQEDQLKNKKNNDSESDEEVWNYIDYATSKEWVSPVGKALSGKQGITLVQKPIDSQETLLNRENRNINQYKDLLSNVEFKVLDLLNSGKEKRQILNSLKISKQRFSFLTKSITKKISNIRTNVY